MCYFVFNVETQGVKKSRSFRGIQSTILTAVGSSVLLHPNIKLFRPYQAMKEIYLRSRIDTASTPSYSIVTAWWGLWLISEIINRAIARQFFQRERYRHRSSPRIERFQHIGRFSDYCRRNSGFCSSASDHRKSGNQLEQNCGNKGNSRASSTS